MPISTLLGRTTWWLLMTSLVTFPVAMGGKRKYALNRPEQPRMLPLGYKIHPFHFPWSCVITYLHNNAPGYRHQPSLQFPVGMCSILTKKYIFASINNLNEGQQDVTADGENYYSYQGVFWQRMWDLVVWANLRRVKHFVNRLLAQEKRVHNMWVPLTASAYTDKTRYTTENEFFYLNPRSDYNITDEVEMDVAGFAASIVMMEVKKSVLTDYDHFVFNEWVLPMPLFPELKAHDTQGTRAMDLFTAKIEVWRQDLETFPQSYGPCSIGSFGISGLIDKRRETRFMMLQVVIIPMFYCQEIFCQFDMSYCGRYPIQNYHTCFKSLTYPDVCQFDEGAALYCNWANQSVLAVLSRGFSCGLWGLPGVYTSVGVLVHMYKRVLKKQGYYTDIPNRSKDELIGQDRYKWTIPDVPPTPTPDDALPVPWSRADD